MFAYENLAFREFEENLFWTLVIYRYKFSPIRIAEKYTSCPAIFGCL